MTTFRVKITLSSGACLTSDWVDNTRSVAEVAKMFWDRYVIGGSTLNGWSVKEVLSAAHSYPEEWKNLMQGRERSYVLNEQHVVSIEAWEVEDG